MRIGIDIGGTNTDGVIIDGQDRIIEAVKYSTTAHLEKGFEDVLTALLNQSKINSEQIMGVFVGTTHATNAILQCKDLYRVGVIRLAGHQPITLPPAYGWPKKLLHNILSGSLTLDGGFECDGRSLTKFNSLQIQEAAQKLIEKGAESLAICGVFSPLHPEQEVIAAEIIRKALGENVPVSLSHCIGGIGFIERENATILNAALKKVMKSGFKYLLSSCQKLGVQCPLYVTQNNGSLISLEEAMEYPVLTISAGPTNSFVGGVKLAGLNDALVVDIGGTSTDVGVVHNGFPRRCLHNSSIGGVSLNFSMPDVISIAVGGGSHVRLEGNQVVIGPESVSRKLFEEAVSFGGPQLTLTDIALALGHIKIPQARVESVIGDYDAKCVINAARDRIYSLVKQIEAEKGHLPVILVGGGASLIPLSVFGDRYIHPEHASVANAYGAALAEVAVTVNKVVCLDNREAEIELLKEETFAKLRNKGACSATSRIVDVSVLPYFYMPGNLARITVTAAGKQDNLIQ